MIRAFNRSPASFLFEGPGSACEDRGVFAGPIPWLESWPVMMCTESAQRRALRYKEGSQALSFLPVLAALPLM